MVLTVGKSHEQRIAELERLVADLQRVVGVPANGLGGLNPNWAAAQAGLQQAQQSAMQAAQVMQAGVNGAANNG